MGGQDEPATGAGGDVGRTAKDGLDKAPSDAVARDSRNSGNVQDTRN